MSNISPLKLLELFSDSLKAERVGQIDFLEYGVTCKMNFSRHFHALSIDPLKRHSNVIVIESTKFLSYPTHEAVKMLNDTLQANGLLGDDFLVLLHTTTTSNTQLTGIVKQTPYGDLVRSIKANEIIIASKKPNKSDMIRRLLTKNSALTLLNPYHSNQKTTGMMFFGRHRLRKEIKQKRQHIWIYGPRRIGKSSLVLQLQQEWGYIELNSNKKIRRASYVDVSKLSDPNEQLFNEILNGFGIGPGDVRSLSKIKRLVGRDVRDLSLDSEPGSLLEALFKRHPKKLVIILDEVDNWLGSDEISEGANKTLNRLRAITDENRAKVVLVGYENLSRSLHSGNFPFFGRGSELFLGPTNRENMENLILDPLSRLGVSLQPRDQVLAEFWNATTGRVNIVQEICSTCVEQISSLTLRARIIDLHMVSHILRQNDAWIRMQESVKHLKRPLAAALCITALDLGEVFMPRELMRELGWSDVKFSDVENSLRFLRIRNILSHEQFPGKGWRWGNRTVKKGAKLFIEEYGKNQLIKDYRFKWLEKVDNL